MQAPTAPSRSYLAMAYPCRAPSPLRACTNLSEAATPSSSSPPSPTMSDQDSSSAASTTAPEVLEPLFNLTLTLHSKPIDLPFYDESATIQDLSDSVAEALSIPPTNQKFLITPKTGLLKPPFKDPILLLSELRTKKIVLMGATTAEVASLEASLADHRARAARRQASQQAGRKVKAHKTRDWKKVQEEAQFTFHSIKPLPYLPAPEKSARFLERLANDAGIKSSMRKHNFSVGLLTEMNPVEHTTHESRTLGLNRNRGEVIELRLRTDAYDGYRDYKVIRKTLCHELAHNVWGEHDANFWKLCREIEGEVERNDWRRGGHSVGGKGQDEFYNPDDEGVDEEADGGGWVGGEYTLGSGTEGASGSSAPPTEPLSRREIMAKAAEERMRRLTETKSPQPPESKAKDEGRK